MFVKENVSMFFHIPLNFSSVMKKLDEKVRNAHATIPEGGMLLRSYIEVEYGFVPCD